MKAFKSFISPIFFGTLLGLSWLEFENFGWLVFIGIGYIFQLQENKKKFQKIFLEVLLFLLPWFTIACFYLNTYSFEVYGFAVGGFTIIYGLTLLINCFITRNIGLVRGLISTFTFFPAIEYLQGEYFPMVPWFSLANSLVNFQFTDFILPIAGSSGVTLFILVVSYLLFEFAQAILKVKKLNPKKALLLVPFIIIWLNSNKQFTSNSTEKLIVIQPQTRPNKTPNFKQIHKTLDDLNDSQIEESTILFPESFVKLPADQNNKDCKNLISFLNKNKADFLLGIVNEDPKNYTNQIVNQKSKILYEKTKLVPIVECPIFSTLNKEFKNEKNIAICFESIFPNYFKENSNNQNLFFVFTNDVWFQNTSAYLHHALLLKNRALENGITIIRIANTGLSGVFYPNGNMELLPKEKIINQIVVTTMHSKTSFYKNGDVLGRIAVFTSLFLLLFAFVKHQKSE